MSLSQPYPTLTYLNNELGWSGPLSALAIRVEKSISKEISEANQLLDEGPRAGRA